MCFSKEYAQLVQEQKRLCSFIHPLMCGLEFSPEKKQESRCLKEYDHLLKMALEKSWQNLPGILEPLHNPATAIVVTSVEEQIEWVSEGFLNMTGYLAEEAIGRNPNFLQGQETDQQDVHQFRQLVKRKKPFSAVLLNYKKSGEPYQCKINVYPMFDNHHQLVNFLAIENEVAAQPAW